MPSNDGIGTAGSTPTTSNQPPRTAGRFSGGRPQPGESQLGQSQTGAAQTRAAQTRAAQTRAAQTGAAQAGTAGVDAPVNPPLDQPFDAEALFALRSAVAAHAAELGAGSAVGDSVLVAHELSSNAVRHGGGSGRLLLWRDGERLYCRVTDSGAGLADPAHAGTSRPSPSVPGGRGLWIARQLAAIEIATGPAGTTVTAALTLRAGN